MKDSTYWNLHAQGIKAMEEARFKDAEEAFAAARREALAQGLAGLADRAYCNWTAIRQEHSDLLPGIGELSRILGASTDAKARQLAAYYLGVCFSIRGNLKAAALYSEISCRLAETQGDLKAQAASHNSLGLISLAEYRLRTAAEHFRKSLDLSLRSGASAHAAMTMSTLGYDLSLAGSWTESLWMLEESLQALEGSAARIYEPSIRLNLGFSYLESGDYEDALQQGLAALDSSQERGASHEMKFASYLVGEAKARQGDSEGAEENFKFLQKTWYPEHPELTEVLLSIRTSRWLNWLGR